MDLYRIVPGSGHGQSSLFEVGIPHGLCAEIGVKPGRMVLVETGDVHTGLAGVAGRRARRRSSTQSPCESYKKNRLIGIVSQLAVDTQDDKYIEIHDAALVFADFTTTEKVTVTPIAEQIPQAQQLVVHLEENHALLKDRTFLIYLKATLRARRFLFPQTSLSIKYWSKYVPITIGRAVTLGAAPRTESLEEAFEVTHATDIDVCLPENAKSSVAKPVDIVRYRDIGGLESQLKLIREFIEFPLTNPEMYTKYGLKPPRGILLKGPPGTGKTMIVKAVANEAQVHYKAISGPELLSKFYGETELRLKEAFDECIKNSPSLLFIDEIDSICPKREVASELESRIITTLLTLMDGIGTDNSKPFIVIACTNKPDNLDSAIRRPGRFDKEITIDIPSPSGRHDILEKIIYKLPNQISEQDIEKIVSQTHGYVGSDLAALVRDSSFYAVKKFKQSERVSSSNLRINELPVLTLHHIEKCIPLIKPSAIREVTLEVPKVNWSDIGGNEILKERLIEAIQMPLLNSNIFEEYGIKPPKGILMYGPPGCSKTLMAKAIATESNQNFLAVKGPELFSKWVGESEKSIREIFKKARAAAPSIIFFDEIDSIAVKRGASSGGGTSVGDRVLTQLLAEMDGIETLNNVTIIAATNRPDIIDEALMRPGRIDRILYVPPPNENARHQIFSNQSKKMPLASDITVEELVSMSEGYSGAECVQLCQEAAISALDNDISATLVSKADFELAQSGIKPQITRDMLEYYEEFAVKSHLKHVV